jgi:DNA polymerase IIIc chi subunit
MGYHAYVTVFKRKLWVTKHHDFCPHEWYLEQEEQMRDDLEVHETAETEANVAAVMLVTLAAVAVNRRFLRK